MTMPLLHRMLAPATAILIAAAAGTATAQTVVRIGHVAPLTGGIAQLGRDSELGAWLAIEDLNARRLKIGGSAVRFELHSEDDAADPRQALAAAKKLVDAPVHGVIGHLNSVTTIQASRLYHEAGIPQISPSVTDPRYTQQGYRTAFRMVAHDGRLGGTLGRYAVRQVKARHVAIVDDRSAYGQDAADAFERAVTAAGAKVVGRESTPANATEFDALLSRLKARKPDLIFFGGLDAVAGPMIRQMKALGLQAKYMGGDGICSPALPALADGAIVDGQVFCAEAGGIPKDKQAAMAAWQARFRERTGAEPGHHAPYAYDAVMAMAASMQKAQSVEPSRYLPALARVNHDGITGRIAFDDRGDIRDGNLTIFTYRDGRREAKTVVK